MGMHVEYVGFTTENKTRDYRLRTQDAGVIHDYVRSIALEAFVSRRARYQDAPEICFLKLLGELAACVGTLPEARVSVTDSDLDAYRVAHLPKPPNRRPRPPVPQAQ